MAGMTLRFREAFAVLVGRKVASRPALDFRHQDSGREQQTWPSSASVTYRHYEGQRIGDDPDAPMDRDMRGRSGC